MAKDKEWSYINCKSNDITYLELIQNGFWQEVVATNLDNKSNTKLKQVNHTNFKTQHLFSNDLIRYKGKVLFFPKWRNKGIETIKDVIHPDEKRLLSLVEIGAPLGQNSADSILEYNALDNRIPKQWCEWLRGENNDVYIRPPCEAMLCNVKPKQVKKILMANKVLSQMHAILGRKSLDLSKGRSMAHSLENNKRNETRSVAMENLIGLYIQQIFCLIK